MKHIVLTLDCGDRHCSYCRYLDVFEDGFAQRSLRACCLLQYNSEKDPNWEDLEKDGEDFLRSRWCLEKGVVWKDHECCFRF